MQLRTVVGAHAGEIRDYTFMAAQDALRDGMAEPVRASTPDPVVVQPDTIPSPVAATNHTGRRRAAHRE